MKEMENVMDNVEVIDNVEVTDLATTQNQSPQIYPKHHMSG